MSRIGRTTRALGVVVSLCAGTLPFAGSASAQEYPSQPIELVIPYDPGGSSDIVARILAEPLAKELGQPIVVLNKPGASSIVGSQFVANSKADGYTILSNTAAYTVIANKPDLPYDPLNDFIPITRFAGAPYLLVVNPEKLPVDNVKELIETIKAAPPGTYNYASTGVGASAHLAAELFKAMAGVEITHVPYPGGAGPGVQATIAGQTHMTFSSPASATMAAIEEGKLKAIAVSGPERWDGMPDLPTVAEQGLDGFAVEFWSGLFVPAGTPDEVVERLNQAVRAALEDPQLSEKFAGFHYSKPVQSAAEFGDFIKADIEKWGQVIKAADIPL